MKHLSENIHSGLSVCTLFESEAETEITVAGMKKPFCFCSAWSWQHNFSCTVHT